MSPTLNLPRNLGSSMDLDVVANSRQATFNATDRNLLINSTILADWVSINIFPLPGTKVKNTTKFGYPRHKSDKLQELAQTNFVPAMARPPSCQVHARDKLIHVGPNHTAVRRKEHWDDERR